VISKHPVLPESRSSAVPRSSYERDVGLVELLDRLLEGGVAIDGELVLAVADIDLVRVGLRLVLASVECLERGTDDQAVEVSATTP
jgi:Gas vesicle protein